MEFVFPMLLQTENWKAFLNIQNIQAAVSSPVCIKKVCPKTDPTADFNGIELLVLRYILNPWRQLLASGKL